ncbi:MAG TPA: glycosyltransferase family 39 protein [Chthoniobacterales bacterium]|nr:glycosyltransferase family 39 protein [Chthoniobacterales bacterium]
MASDGKVWLIVGLAAIGFLAASLFHTINLPWVEEDNAFGAAYAQAARNNLRAGLAVTAGVPATFYNDTLPIPADAYYVHHPVLFPLLVTAAVATLGEKEWVVKLVPILCSLVSAALLWLLVEGDLSKRAAAFVVAIFVTLPMELHYGDLVDYEPCLVMWMLAALVCLRNWELLRTPCWAILAALCCLGAVSTDWPGYLFTGAVAIWLLWKREKQSRRLALALVALAFSSGILILLQFRHVNPEAWSDLWTAITMRLGTGIQSGSSASVSSGDVRFGFWDWLRRILQALNQDYLPVTWPLLVLGAFYLFRRRNSAGPRWAATAALLMAAAGIPYLVILRNWSFIHDFASFSAIGSIAILGGCGVEAIWRWIENRSRPVAAVALALFFPLLAWAGFNRADNQRSQFQILVEAEQEPANLIPDLGRFLAKIFPGDTEILCNFDPYYSPLSYYAGRTILRNLGTPDEWKFAVESNQEEYGGVIWLEAPDAAEIIAVLPKAELSEVEIDGIRFGIWRRSTR